MKFASRICLICCLLAATAHRLPAPIVETEEKATPAPEQSEAPKPKEKHSRAKLTTQSDEPGTKPEPRVARTREGPARFAGTWAGTINQGILGNVQVTLTVNDAATSVRETSMALHFTHPAILNGNTLSWQAGVLNEIAWTLRPNSDGRTALATAHSGLGVNGSATFRRAQNAPASVTANPAEFPTAKPDPNRPGFVYNPFDPTATHLLDVRGKPSGSKVIEPKSGRTFIVP
jgi:hypothetical protein